MNINIFGEISLNEFMTSAVAPGLLQVINKIGTENDIQL